MIRIGAKCQCRMLLYRILTFICDFEGFWNGSADNFNLLPLAVPLVGALPVAVLLSFKADAELYICSIT